MTARKPNSSFQSEAAGYAQWHKVQWYWGH